MGDLLSRLIAAAPSAVVTTTTMEVALRTVESATVPGVGSGGSIGSGPTTTTMPRQVIQLPIPGVG